jgi:hypothetical protein
MPPLVHRDAPSAEPSQLLPYAVPQPGVRGETMHQEHRCAGNGVTHWFAVDDGEPDAVPHGDVETVRFGDGHALQG